MGREHIKVTVAQTEEREKRLEGANKREEWGDKKIASNRRRQISIAKMAVPKCLISPNETIILLNAADFLFLSYLHARTASQIFHSETAGILLGLQPTVILSPVSTW